MQRGPLLYQGKSKQVFATDDPQQVVLRFTDQATAFNAKKVATVPDKGRINCAINAHLLRLLAEKGIDSHLVEVLGEQEILCRKVEIVPVEVVVRNRAAGSFSKRYAIPEGTELAQPLVEFFFKSDALDDPLVSPDTAVVLGWAKRWELEFLKETALRINAILCGFWDELGVDLIDAKYEFGRVPGGALLLADEITPDGARLWDRATGAHLDKDVFRRDLGDLGDTYRALLARVTGG